MRRKITSTGKSQLTCRLFIVSIPTYTYKPGLQGRTLFRQTQVR